MNDDEMHAQIEQQMAEMKRRMADMMSSDQIDTLLAQHPEIIHHLMDVVAGRLIGVFRGYRSSMSNDPNQPTQQPNQPRQQPRPGQQQPQPGQQNDPNQPMPGEPADDDLR